MYVISTENATGSQIFINGARNLHVINACNLNLTVSNSTVSYTRSKVNYDSPTIETCASAGSLTASNSTFQMIVAGRMEALNLVKSTAREIQLDDVQHVELVNETDVKLFVGTVNGQTILKNSSLSFLNTYFKGGLHALDVVFQRVSPLESQTYRYFCNNFCIWC